MSILSRISPSLAFTDLDEAEMYRAIRDRDLTYDGLFVIGVRTTGIFCRPGCPAKTPRRENVRYFPAPREAVAAGFRPCKRCRPLARSGESPSWLDPLLQQVEFDPNRRWRDRDITELGLDPTRVSRWFKEHHGMTFHGYLRCRRLSASLAQLSLGDDMTQVAFDAGYSSLSGFRDAFQKWFGAPPGQAKQRDAVLVNRVLSPLGPLIIAASQEALLLLEFADRRMLETQVSRLADRLKCSFCPGESELMQQAQQELTEYFAGTRELFSVPHQMVGSDFQCAVWSELLKIRYGATRSYEQIARRVGRPHGSRAVGRANGDNRLAVIIPCHRVIRADGSLSGYGGGVRRKEWLLDHESGHSRWPKT